MSTGTLMRSRAGGDVMPGPARTATTAMVLGLGCYLAQQVSIALRFVPSRFSTIWLPGGLLLAALLVVPPRRWRALLPGAAAGIFAALLTDEPTVVLAGVVALTCGLFAGIA